MYSFNSFPSHHAYAPKALFQATEIFYPIYRDSVNIKNCVHNADYKGLTRFLAKSMLSYDDIMRNGLDFSPKNRGAVYVFPISIVGIKHRQNANLRSNDESKTTRTKYKSLMQKVLTASLQLIILLAVLHVLLTTCCDLLYLRRIPGSKSPLAYWIRSFSIMVATGSSR